MVRGREEAIEMAQEFGPVLAVEDVVGEQRVETWVEERVVEVARDYELEQTL